MTVILSFFLLFVSLLLDLNRAELTGKSDPTVISAYPHNATGKYFKVVVFENKFKGAITVNDDGYRCKAKKFCVCIEAFNKKLNAVACGKASTSMCLDWSRQSGRSAQVILFTNAKGSDLSASFHGSLGKNSVINIEVLLQNAAEAIANQNQTIAKIDNSEQFAPSWALFQQLDSDKYGLVNYINIKVVSMDDTCDIEMNLLNGAVWIKEVKSVFHPEIDAPDDEEEETTQPVAIAGTLPKMRIHSWIVCIVGIVIWMIWTVIYITLIALAFNRLLCFVMMDPGEVVEDVQVLAQGKNP